MTVITKQGKSRLTVATLSGILLIAGFLLPWVKWDTARISGMDFPTNQFFTISENSYGLGNPFPEYAWLNHLFWIIPIAGLFILLLSLRKKSTGFVAIAAGCFTLALGLIYLLFSKELSSLDNTISIPASLQPGLYLALTGAIGAIFSAWPQKWIAKLLFLIAPVVITWLGFTSLKDTVMNEAIEDTAQRSADFSFEAIPFIAEFITSDSAANARYREKVIVLTGIATEINTTDSTATLTMADSTGSYVIFDFNKGEVDKVKAITPGNTASVKGICSGGIYSDIMETETISFKYAVINKQ